MSTDIFYNGVELHNVYLEDFIQTPIRDPSDTDQLFSEFAISAEAVVNLDSYNASVAGSWVHGAGLPGGVAAASSHEAFNLIKMRLTNDRAPFSMTMEGVEMLAADSASDAQNGPKVTSLKMSHMSASMVRIKWSIKITLPACPDGGSNTDWPVISNRWSVIDDVDDSLRTSRTWQGTLVLAHLPTIRTPHLFRHLCVPPLVKGWKRKTMRFTGEPHGLVLGYVVNDAQLMCESAPYPAKTYRIIHKKRWNALSMKQNEVVNVDLTGPIGVDRKLLVSRAFQILTARGRVALMDDFGKRLIRDFDIAESFSEDDCAVSGSITIEHMANDLTSGVMGVADVKPLGDILTLPQPEDENDPAFYDPKKSWWNGAPWGTGMGLVVSTLAAQWQTPCTAGHGMIQGSETIPDQPATPTSSQEPTEVTYQLDAPPDMQPPEINEDAIAHFYNHARVESQLDTDFGWVGLPLATQPEEGAAVIGVQLHAPTTIRTVRIASERIGAAPKRLKAKQFTDSQGVVHWPLGRRLIAQAKEQLPDGKELHSLTMEYRYQLDREYTDEQPIPVGVLPWDTQTPADTRLSADDLIEPDDNEKGIA
jgi:hypothetical protein